MVIRPLSDQDFELVYAAFIEAFSDYLVKMNPSRQQFNEMLTRRAYVPQLSAGAFQDERLVAFALNGVEAAYAYNTGTGVVPALRRTGLGRAVLELSYSLLRARRCTRYLLEVLEANEAAVALYRAAGFLVIRRLQCWSLASITTSFADPLNKSAAGPPDWSDRTEWWDVKPSWQNSTNSINRARDRFLVLGDPEGYAVVFPSTGDLPQLAVHPARRHRGIGTHLLRASVTKAGKPLRIMNVDDRNEGIVRFLEHVGAIRTVRQIEMERAL